MTLEEIKQKYMVDINFNYKPKTNVEKRLGNALYQGKESLPRQPGEAYSSQSLSPSKEYENRIRKAKQRLNEAKADYQKEIQSAKESLKKQLAVARSGSYFNTTARELDKKRFARTAAEKTKRGSRNPLK